MDQGKDSLPDTSSDPDWIEQAKPGHGVPGQDPDPAAQYPIEPERAAEEQKTVYMGGGVMAGAAVGAAVGTAVAGPVGTFVGTMAGAVAGAVGGAAAGAIAQPGEAGDEAAKPPGQGSAPSA